MYSSKSPLSFVLESILLFEACLLQFSQYAAAATASSNLSTTNSGCTGCTISVAPTTLSYPSAVSDVTQSVTATVIPYITQYDNINITSYSTFYGSGASGQTAITSPTTTNLTWTTLGTTLTYPTTYLAFPSPVAGVSKSFSSANSFCYASLTAIRLSATDIAHLIFPSSVAADHARITQSVVSFLDTLPTISAQVSPYQPSQCSPFAGPPSQTPLASSSTVAATNAPASSVAAVTHTSVQFLITQGQAVITRSPGTAQPQTSPQTTPQGASGMGSGGSITTSKPPVLTVGGTTITAGPSGAFTVGGHTLAPGGSAVVVGGTTISLAAGGSAAVVNGQTSTLGAATGSSSTTSSSTSAVGSSAASKIWLSGAAVGALGLLVGLFL